MVFIHCDFLKRDIVTSLLIKKYIDKNVNTKAYITSRINTRIFFKFFYKHTWILNTDMYFYLLEKEPIKIKQSNIIIYEQEGFVGDKARAIMFNNGKDLEYVDKIIVWGKKSYEHLVNGLNIDKKKVSIGGVYRLLNCKPRKIAEIREIGVVTRHTTLKKNITSNIVERVYEETFSDEKPLYSVTAAIQRSLQEISTLFKSMKELDNNYKYSFRLHPLENNDIYSFLNKKTNSSIDTKTDFSSWLNTIDVVISPPSSSLFECIAAKKPVYYVNGDNSIIPNINDLSYDVFYKYAKNIENINDYRDTDFDISKDVQIFIDDYYNSFNCDFSLFRFLKKEKVINEKYLKSLDMIIHIYMLKNKEMLDFDVNYSAFFSKLNISMKTIDAFDFKNGSVSV